MKKILGLDLGTTSIGWAFVHEAQAKHEQSQIIKTGVRVIPLTTDEKEDFSRGKSITTNADRTLKRAMRRNLYRYQMRRDAVIAVFKKMGFIDATTTLSEKKGALHETYQLRAKAVTEKIGKAELVRVVLMLNKKRGYKSSRKSKSNEEDGQLIDGMAIARLLHEKNQTPGTYSYYLLKNGKKVLPDYYPSDLLQELEAIWNFQRSFYPDILTKNHLEALRNKNLSETIQYLEKEMGLERAENKGKDRKITLYQWRDKAVKEKMGLSEIAYIIAEINNQINNSSKYLGAIGDRSKELYFNNQTVGQYLYEILKQNPHNSLKNRVFYRQDYIDEFNAIWKQQSLYYPQLTDELKKELRDITIFYQRPLKSQKGLISICEFEGAERTVQVNGKAKKKSIGPRVAPRSSPLFQQTKIWQTIHDLKVSRKDEPDKKYDLEPETLHMLFDELNVVHEWKPSEFLKWLFKGTKEKPGNWNLNFKSLQGNSTNATLFKVYKDILESEGYNGIDFTQPVSVYVKEMGTCFKTMGIDPRVLELDTTLQGDLFIQQPAYHLWHLLYSYQDDRSLTGTEALVHRLEEHFGFPQPYAKQLAAITFIQDYGSLSTRALRKIYPFLEAGNPFSDACALAGYHLSNTFTTEENKNRQLLDTLPLVTKNALRNPVVEKILNQMIHVVNTVIKDPALGKPDEVRIEMARELKKTAKQRNELTKSINKATREHEAYRKLLQNDFGLTYVSRNDLIKYKLYLELKPLGFKTLYSGTYIKPEELFTSKFDVEHIIPRALLFDDSFSNKTLELRNINIEKGNETAYDYCERKGWLPAFESRVNTLFAAKAIGYAKREKLRMQKENLPEDFLNRDLGNTAYIARKAIALLKTAIRDVHPTSGKITDALRSDWELIDVLKELQWEKYEAQGLTYYEYNREGKKLPRIEGWSKRDDHRHHAMDAITVAFTNRAIVQYLNNLNASGKQESELYGIRSKYTFKDPGGQRRFVKPFENIREEAKKHLASILVSYKAKNKVVTRNRNKTKAKGKNNFKYKTELTPRGQLHNETIYARKKFYIVKEEKVNASFTQEKITQVTKPAFRKALEERLKVCENDPKKAFTGKNSLKKNPVVIDAENCVPEMVKLKIPDYQYTIRKEIKPENFTTLKSVEKITDESIKQKLLARIKQQGDLQNALSNLEDHPVWQNKDQGIKVKSVTITGVSNAVPLHIAHDHHGRPLKNDQNGFVQSSYVSTGNNHHLAVYADENGNLDDAIVSFFEAVQRAKLGQPVVRETNEKGWSLIFTLKQNEMFVFPSETFRPKEIDLKNPANKALISKHLFRVQKFSKLQYGNSFAREYVFRHHLETRLNDHKALKNTTYYNIKSLQHLAGIVKVRLNHLGNIVHIGEY
ncbi:type II CRISPR RNA-guided endonuclease Cas9 [Ascidiimonas aurantiaca]|uniref:type II CRISPR RNA-guided endonuclease Cas9 n=1 Tax=Ascidiimonas aurantiaca TaxID=1685432 RepID=UPI0030EB648E